MEHQQIKIALNEVSKTLSKYTESYCVKIKDMGNIMQMIR